MLRKQRALTEEITADNSRSQLNTDILCPSLEMFNILVIFVFVDLFVADIICAMEFKVKSLEIGTSGAIPCDHVQNDPEVHVVQWYKSRRIDEFINGDDSLAWWSERESGSLPNYHMEITTFSLVIGNATLEDEGLYKCFVVRGEAFKGSDYFTRTVMYALPRMDPKITLDNDWNRVHCTVEHVKPVIYPVLNFDWTQDNTETYAVLNEDGTYTTSVFCALPQTKSASRVDCYFSYLNYRRDVSLDLRDIILYSLIERKATTPSPMFITTDNLVENKTTPYVTFAESKIGLEIALGVFTLTSFMMLIILMRAKFRVKCHLGVPKCIWAEESEEKMHQPATAMMGAFDKEIQCDTRYDIKVPQKSYSLCSDQMLNQTV